MVEDLRSVVITIDTRFPMLVTESTASPVRHTFRH